MNRQSKSVPPLTSFPPVTMDELTVSHKQGCHSIFRVVLVLFEKIVSLLPALQISPSVFFPHSAAFISAVFLFAVFSTAGLVINIYTHTRVTNVCAASQIILQLQFLREWVRHSCILFILERKTQEASLF